MNTLDSLITGFILIVFMSFICNLLTMKSRGARKWLLENNYVQVGKRDLHLPLTDSAVINALEWGKKVISAYDSSHLSFVAVGANDRGQYRVSWVVFEIKEDLNGERKLLRDSDVCLIGKQHFNGLGMVKIEQMFIQRSESETAPVTC
jgi:hypothetical protein